MDNWNSSQVWKQVTDDRAQRSLKDAQTKQQLRDEGLLEASTLKARTGHVLHELGEQLVEIGERMEGPDAHKLTLRSELS